MNLEKLTSLVIENAKNHSRYIVAIAGPPASGKSTLAENLTESILAKDSNSNPIIVPMDGFHLDNSVLDKLGLREHKGASNTFDANGFIELINSIRTEDESLLIPTFDRTLDSVVEGTHSATKENKIIVVEGNYLFLKDEPWNALIKLFDLALFLKPKITTLEQRLIQRWLDNGHELASAKERAFSNDIPNAKFVLENSANIDLTFEEVKSITQQ